VERASSEGFLVFYEHCRLSESSVGAGAEHDRDLSWGFIDLCQTLGEFMFEKWTTKSLKRI